jgi:hypothetical protein
VRRVPAAAAAAAFVLAWQAADAGALSPSEVPKTQVNSTAALQKLIGNHGITVQWNWETGPGALNAEARDGWLALQGSQHARNGGDVSMNGVVTRVDERSFLFRGRIVIHDAEANVDCVRDGDYTFRITGARKYWRMKEQEAHCPGRADLTDYVDIHF